MIKKLIWSDVLQEYRQKSPDEVLFTTKIELDELGQHLVGMLNVAGGTVYIGVDFSNFHLRGSNLKTDQISQIMQTYCEPSTELSFSELDRGQKIILGVTVPDAPKKPYTYKKTCYVRKNGTTSLATDETIEALKEALKHKRFDPEPAQESLLPDSSDEDDVSDEGDVYKDSISLENETVSEESIEDKRLIPSTPHPYFTLSHQDPVEDLESSVSPVDSTDTPMLPIEQINNSDPHKSTAPVDTTVPVKSTAPVDTLESPAKPVTPSAKSVSDDPSHSTSHFPMINLPPQFIPKLNKRQKKAITYLKRHQFIKNKKYRTMFKISHKTAHLELVDLVSQGLIIPQGAGRSTCYVITNLAKSSARKNNKQLQTLQSIQRLSVQQSTESDRCEPPVMVSGDSADDTDKQTHPVASDVSEDCVIDTIDDSITEEQPSQTTQNTHPQETSTDDETLSTQTSALEVVSSREDAPDIDEEELNSSLHEIKDIMDTISTDIEEQQHDHPSKPLRQTFQDRKEFLMSYLKINSMISSAQYSALLNITEELSKRDLDDFIFTGELSKIQRDGEGFYRLPVYDTEFA